MSTLVDAILTLKARLTTRVTPEQILALRADVNTIADDVRFLESENAKLRELVVALQHCRDGRCDGECPMFTPADNNRGVPPVCEAYGAMRELGVEVRA